MKRIRIPVLLFLFCVGISVNAGASSWPLFLAAIMAGANKEPAEPDIRVPLNDTGIIWSADYPAGNTTLCTDAAQDCSHGRDVTDNNNSNGHAGFNFTKLDSLGVPLEYQNVDYATAPWVCVRDNTTGLIWEVKTNDGGLHDRDNEYSWYNSDMTTNGGDPGSNSGDNTEDYVTAVNNAGFCGSSQWRMPTIKELVSIINFNITELAIDQDYFPNINGLTFWSSTTSASDTGKAWGVEFGIGYTDKALTKAWAISRYVRLVR